MTEVTELINERRVGAFQIKVMVLCALVLLFDGYDLQVMGVAVPAVAESWGVPPTTFVWALTASLIGMAFGAFFVSPLGDRLGRKPLVIASFTLCGLATVATAFSASYNDFILWRFLTGIGMGGVVGNATALTSEYMPARKRTWLVTLMYVSVPFGAFSAGLIAPQILKVSDWRGLFIFGGVGTLLATAIFWALAPESLKFLLARRPGSGRIAPILAKLAPGIDPATVTIAPDVARKHSFFDLLAREYRARTALLWTIYVFNIFIIFLLTSWLATLLRAAGWPSDQALVGSVLFQLGGVAGGIALATQVDRGRPNVALMIGYVVCALALAGLLIIPSSFANWALLLLLVGFGISGAQNILVALAAAFYPLTIRATGVGGAIGVGRIGAISAPPIGALILANFTPVQALGLMIIPALICAAGSFLVRKQWLER